MLSMFLGRSYWGAVAKVPISGGCATKKARKSQNMGLDPHSDTWASLSSSGKWGCRCPGRIVNLLLMDSRARGPGSDLYQPVTSLLPFFMLQFPCVKKQG